MSFVLFQMDDPAIAIAENGGNEPLDDRDEDELSWLEAYGTTEDYADYYYIKNLLASTRHNGND